MDRAARLRITFISWAESCRRRDHTARELGGRSHMVYAAGFGSRPSLGPERHRRGAERLRQLKLLRWESTRKAILARLVASKASSGSKPVTALV